MTTAPKYYCIIAIVVCFSILYIVDFYFIDKRSPFMLYDHQFSNIKTLDIDIPDDNWNSFNNLHQQILNTYALHNEREYFLLLNRMDNEKSFPKHTVLTFSPEYGNILYHCNFMHAGLGNNLLSYWFSRGIAFFFNMKYRSFFEAQEIKLFNTSDFLKNKLETFMKPHFCKINDKRWKDGHGKAQRLESFLPIFSNMTFDTFIAQIAKGGKELKDISNKYSVIQQYMLRLMIKAVVPDKPRGNTSTYDGDFIYEFERMRTYAGVLYRNNMYTWLHAKWSMFYQNDIMRQIMHTETEEAFELMREQRYIQKENAIYGKYNHHDITIHIRCGDIMRTHVDYNGFQTMKFFENAKNVIQQRLNVSTYDKVLKGANVYVVMNILDNNATYNDKNSFLDNKLEDHYKCRIYSNYIMEHFRNSIFFEYNNVYLISNGTMHGDYYKLMHSANVICGFSTYCMSASLCNTDAKTVVLPNQFFDQHDFMPTGFMLVENTWISSTQVLKSNFSAIELANYIISH